MSDFVPILTSKAGITWSIKDDDAGPGATIKAETDLGVMTDILERNQALAVHNDGYTPDKSMRRAATIPVGVQMLWLTKYGVDVFSQDPDQQRRVCELLDSSEWRYLRTAEFRLGDHWRKSI